MAKIKRRIARNAALFLSARGSGEVARDLVSRAAEDLLRALRRQARSGTVDGGLGSVWTFLSYAKRARKGHNRAAMNDKWRGVTKVPKKEREEGSPTPFFDRIRQDTDTTYDVETSVNDALLVVTAALLPRILNVLAQRSGNGGLSADQVEAYWVMLYCTNMPVSIPAEHVPVIELFKRGEENWPSHLLRIRGTRPHGRQEPSSVNHDISRARRLVATCLYLFITLAPYSSVVQDEADMTRLLDLIFTKSKDFFDGQSDLVKKAGACVRLDDYTYRVDTVAAHAAVRKLQSFKKHTLAQMVDDLHAAEAKYAIHVPGQDRFRPRFDCVKRCAAHSSESMKP